MDDDVEDSVGPLVMSCTSDADCVRVMDSQCSFGSVTPATQSPEGLCICPIETPILHRTLFRCLAKASLNESCVATEQCSAKEKQSFCYIPNEQDQGHCECYRGYHALFQGTKSWCIRDHGHNDELSVDPAMMGIMCALILMFVIICIVLRMFSKQRFQEQRTIFNTPNPRLMNLSLLSSHKAKHGRDESRHGSSMSLQNKHSHNGSNKDVEVETPLTNVCSKSDPTASNRPDEA